MSYNQVAIDSLNKNVMNFILDVSKTFSIDETALKNLWNGDKVQAKRVLAPSTSIPPASSAVVEPSSSSSSSPSPSSSSGFLPTPASPEIFGMTVVELQALCKVRGLKSSGKKQDLIDRLIGKESAPSATKPATSASTTAPSKKKPTTATEDAVPKVVKQVQSTLQPVSIKKNSFGNFEHNETGFVFDKITQKVIGRQNKSGSIDPLNDADIEVCNKFKFKYVIPENLNTTSVATTAVVEGIDDENAPEDASDPTDAVEEVVEEEEEIVEEEEEVVEEQEFFEDEE
jgi:hypothetical protein